MEQPASFGKVRNSIPRENRKKARAHGKRKILTRITQMNANQNRREGEMKFAGIRAIRVKAFWTKLV
jgi:hypothetical protein